MNNLEEYLNLFPPLPRQSDMDFDEGTLIIKSDTMTEANRQAYYKNGHLEKVKISIIVNYDE